MYETLVDRLSRDPRVQAIYLFGSAVEGAIHAGSDIDFAVWTTGELSLGDELRLRAVAVEELHRDDVDFVILDQAPPLLQYEVVTRGRRLFARNPEAADLFEHRAIMRYMDTEQLRRIERELLREATR